MKRHFTALMLFLSIYSGAQVFPVDTITPGPSSNRIKLVYMGDGYTLPEMGVYATDVELVNNKLFLVSPFREYSNYFNVYRIRVESAQSGARHSNTAFDCGANTQITNPLNYFGSRFDVAMIHRLVAPDSVAKAQAVLAANLPGYHQAMLIVNSNDYGGSGGWLATSTRHGAAAEISIHELGHSFAGLADEYWAGAVFAAEKPNMTQQSNPALVKWKNWVGSQDVGVFPYDGDQSWYRPVNGARCKMEVLGPPFCAVCREAIVERIHQLVIPLDGYLPAETVINDPADPLGFRVQLLPPDPNTLRIVWRLNGNIIGSGMDSITLQPAQLAGGNNILRATITDTTSFTRSDLHFTSHHYVVEWTISRPTGVISPDLFSAGLRVFPNPFAETLNFSFQLSRRSDVRIELFTADGKLVKKLEFPRQDPGKYQHILNLSGLAMADGIYLVRFSLNGQGITEELIRIRR